VTKCLANGDSEEQAAQYEQVLSLGGLFVQLARARRSSEERCW